MSSALNGTQQFTTRIAAALLLLGWCGCAAPLATVKIKPARLPTALRAEEPLDSVRGPSIMHGYRNNAEATAAVFINGWLRTEDAGVLDADGYLTLTGRIKELINRGGEKIAPSEIDDVLLEYPAVAEAAAFGVPDAKYGEEVWAAVVLKGDANAEQLQALCRARLADFKVPKVIRIVSAIPKNAIGKIERRNLAALFA